MRKFTVKTAKISEATIQKQVVAWARVQAKAQPALARLFHVPNGGSRNPIEAKNLKAQGTQSGVPDLFLPHPTMTYAGLWIELKSATGRLQPSQADWIEYLNGCGYKAVVCNSFDSAVAEIKAYLRDDENV